MILFYRLMERIDLRLRRLVLCLQCTLLDFRRLPPLCIDDCVGDCIGGFDCGCDCIGGLTFACGLGDACSCGDCTCGDCIDACSCGGCRGI